MKRERFNPLIGKNLKRIKALLKEHSATRASKIIQQELSIHWKGVYRYMIAHKLKGISSTQALSLEWSDDMIKILKRGYSKRFNADLAIELRMSKRSVARKAKKLGLKKSKAFMNAHRNHIRRSFRSKKITINDLKNPY